MSSECLNNAVYIRERRFHFFRSRFLSDCKFLVGDGLNNITYFAHKIILASASSVFEKMFCGKIAENCDPIVVPDIQPNTFWLMLQYIYTDRINIRLSLKKAFELYHTADKYNLYGLKKECTDYLLSQLREDNACYCLEFANMFKLETLKEKSLQFIIKNTSDILKQPNFTDISMSTLMTILDQDYLHITSELQLFCALLRFANKRVIFEETNQDVQLTNDDITPDTFQDFICKISEENDNNTILSHNKVFTQNSTSKKRSDNSKVQNKMKNDNKSNFFIKKKVFKKAVKKIRFLTMTPEEFASAPATSNLLTRGEALTFFILISKPLNTQISVPKGFHNSLVKRYILNNVSFRAPQ